jgi:16S rRNA G1207 methylase RsmC
MTVAVIGVAPSSLAQTVGPRGKVIAQDAQTVIAHDHDPKLAVASIDAVLIIQVYRQFPRPEQLLAHLRSALKPGARLFVVGPAAAEQIEAAGFDRLSNQDGVLTFVRP